MSQVLIVNIRLLHTSVCWKARIFLFVASMLLYIDWLLLLPFCLTLFYIVCQWRSAILMITDILAMATAWCWHWLSLLLSHPLFQTNPFILGWCCGCFCCIGACFVVPGILSYMVLLWAFSESGVCWPESWWTNALILNSFHCALQASLLAFASVMQFRLTILTFRALPTGRPLYPTDLLQHHNSTKSMCSFSSYQLLFHNITYCLDLLLFTF